MKYRDLTKQEYRAIKARREGYTELEAYMISFKVTRLKPVTAAARAARAFLTPVYKHYMRLNDANFAKADPWFAQRGISTLRVKPPCFLGVYCGELEQQRIFIDARKSGLNPFDAYLKAFPESARLTPRTVAGLADKLGLALQV